MVILCRRLRMPFLRSRILLLILIVLTSIVTYTQLGANETSKHAPRTSAQVTEELTSCWSKHCRRRHPPSLTRCHVICGSSQIIWPKPTGVSSIGFTISAFHLQGVTLDDDLLFGTTKPLMRKAFNVFKSNLKSMKKSHKDNHNGSVVLVNVLVRKFESNAEYLTLDTNEAYKLTIDLCANSTVEVFIFAATFFGARHALETLSQLIWWEHADGVYNLANDVTVVDKPRFAYRGLMIDTARSFMPMSALRRTVDGMAASKMNALHLHLTDSHSFAYGSRQYPQMSRWGAYSEEQVHKAADLMDLTEYARVRGVRILPEIDVPAHAGVGWQWGEEQGLGKLAVCVEQEPWSEYCGEPPCGQLNPVNENTYTILQDLYEELIEVTHTTDMFHIGGDEVNINCWKKSPEIFPRGDNTPDLDVQDMLTYFHSRAYEALQAANKGKTIANVVVWSTTESDEEVLTRTYPPASYIIQVWGPTSWGELYTHLNHNYRVIISGVDAWYLDCGYGSWVSGREPCFPVSSWQKVYMYRPWDDMSMDQIALVLGGEVCLWSEKVSAGALDTRVWPRAAAAAERLWSDMKYSVNDFEATEKMLNDVTVRLALHVERLKQRGIEGDAVWPEWCNRNPEACFEPKVLSTDGNVLVI